ncbi:MAG: class I SAM-dependent methyltransferase [Chitinophagales bacterium]
MEKYNKIGINYNKTRKADSHLMERLYGYLQPQKEGIYLDIGCGTGNYTIALHEKKGMQFIGIEPATKMLEIAQSKCDSIEWRYGTAEQTGLEDASVDGILATLTLHHWQDLEAAFAEMYRVLKPNGRMVIFTSTPQQMRGYWLNRYFPKMLEKSMQQMPDFEVVEKYLKQSSFQNIESEPYFVHTELKDLFLYAGKHEPHLYLHPNVRKGISSFAELANQAEVEKGLLDLEEDVHSGDWFAVKAGYENEEGDYLFVIAEKI